MTHEGPVVVAARIRRELAALDEAILLAREAADSFDDPSRRKLAVDSAALNVHDVYVGLERIFETIADNIDQSIPDGPNWHRDLLEQMELPLKGRRHAVIPDDLHDDLSRLLGFRHIVRNVYAHHLDPEGVLANVERAERIFPNLRRHLVDFAEWLDSLEEA